MTITSLSDCALGTSLADSNPTWATLAQLKPRLQDLLVDCRSIANNPETSSQAVAAWYGYGSWQRHGLKARMVALVGWNRGKTQKRRPKSELVTLATLPPPPKIDPASLSKGEQILSSQQAFHMAYVTLSEACGCM